MKTYVCSAASSFTYVLSEKQNSAMQSVCSTTTTVEDQPFVAAHPQAAVNPPLSAPAAASLWCFNDQEAPFVLALPVPTPTALSLFPCSPTLQDYHLPTNNHGNLAELIDAASSFSLSLSLSLPINNGRLGPKKPIKNHRWDELIDAATSLSLSLPTKRKRLIIIGPKKPENNSIQVEEKDEGAVIPKKLKKVVDNHHQHWMHKRLSKSDVNLPSRLLLRKEEITKYVLPLMDMEHWRACQNRDGLRVKIWDLDTESQHQLTLKQWKTGNFLFTSNWNTEFVKRRSLHHGDTISMCWDAQNLRFLFHKFNVQS